MQKRKIEIVTRLRDSIPQHLQEPLEQAMKTWWVNLRRDGGMRLTAHGYQIMHDVLRLESWILDLADEPRQIFTKRLILDLDRKLEWPYYIEINMRKKVRHIVFFGSREAMMATMYGDLQNYLASIG